MRKNRMVLIGLNKRVQRYGIIRSIVNEKTKGGSTHPSIICTANHVRFGVNFVAITTLATLRLLRAGMGGGV
jgi:hypothetical protein